MKTPISVILVAGTIGLAALAMACSTTSQGASSGGSTADNPTQTAPAATVAVPTTAPVVTVAPTTAPVVAPTPAPAPTDAPSAPAGNTAPPANSAPPPPPPPAPAAAASSTLTVELGDNSFAPSQLTVAAGTPITVTVNNGGKNMHNFDLQGVAKTPFQPAGQSQAVTFTVQPGTYTFICDVHPKEMIGTLIAQ